MYKVMAENFAARLSQVKLALTDDIADLVKETDFDNKLKQINKKVTSNKTKHVLVENKLDELSEKVEVISTKRLTKDLINGYSILKEAKYFSSGAFQIYLVFISDNKYIEFFSGIQQIYS